MLRVISMLRVPGTIVEASGKRDARIKLLQMVAGGLKNVLH